jgi:hypothetical protein
MIPPWPSLAARMTSQMYLIVTTTITDENTSDRRRKTATFPALPDDLRIRGRYRSGSFRYCRRRRRARR